MKLKIPKNRIKNGQCYMNNFEIVLNNMEKFKSDSYKVCIGYVAYESDLNILYRHAYIVGRKGEFVYDAASEYLKKIACEYNNVHIFDELNYFNHIYENCIKSSNGNINLDSLKEITYDNDLKFIKENNMNEDMIGQDVIVRNIVISSRDDI